MQEDFIGKLKEEFREKLLEQEMGLQEGISGDFKTFQREEIEQRGFKTFYEVYCAFASRYIRLKPPQKIEKKFEEAILISNLNITAQGIIAATILTLLAGILASLPFFVIFGGKAALFSIFFIIFLTYIAYTYAFFVEQLVKIRSQEESLLAVLYLTLYLRLNPVFENAIKFATEHLGGVLGKDLKRILWLVETERVPTIQKAIELHIPLWVKRNPAFVRSLLILQGIMTQEKQKQGETLDRALNTILNDTYLEMKHYAQDLQMPVTMLHLFGMMLPLIGLVAFPLINVFLAGSFSIGSLFFFYIFVLPLVLFFLMVRVLAKRPGAFSFPDISQHPELPPMGKYLVTVKKKAYYIPVLPVALVLGFIIMIPGIAHLFTNTIPALQLQQPVTGNTLLQGEYSIGAFFISLTIPLGMAVACIIYFLGQSIQRVKIRDELVELEDDFADTLFQLSNKFEENIPVETAIEKFLYEYNLLGMKKKSVYSFLSDVIDKIKTEGLTFMKAVFGSTGVIITYPSVLVKEIMWIIIEGAKKGSFVLYNITRRVAIYLQNTKKVKELVHDLLNETSTSINVHAKFMAPLLAAVVGSLTLILIRALYFLAKKIEEVMAMFDMATLANTARSSSNVIGDFFNFTSMVPPTVFQIMIGIYLIEIVILMSYLYDGIKNGFDRTTRNVVIGKNLAIAISIYSLLLFIGVMILQKLLMKTLSAGIA